MHRLITRGVRSGDAAGEPEGQVPRGVRAAQGRAGRRTLRAAGGVRARAGGPRFASASHLFGLALKAGPVARSSDRGEIIRLPPGAPFRKEPHFIVMTVTIVITLVFAGICS